MNKQELKQSGFKPSLYTMPSMLLPDALTLLRAEPCTKQTIKSMEQAKNLADHLQIKYMAGRPSILMAAILYLELRLNRNPRMLKEISIAFDASEKAIRQRAEWVQSKGYYIRNRFRGTSLSLNPSKDKAGRLATFPYSGEKAKVRKTKYGFKVEI